MAATVLADTRGMDRKAWLEARRQGIGSSDAAAVAGLNPWRSPLAAYLDKLGELPEEPENEAMYWGTALEDIVAAEFAKRKGFKVRRRNAILQSAEHPFIIADLDREVREPDGTWSILEAKTGSAWVADRWESDHIPDQYAIQVHHQLLVTGRTHGWIAVLLGGQHFEMRRIEADPEVADFLVNLESAFWRRVQEKNPPPPEGSDSDGAVLGLLYPEDDGTEVELPLGAPTLIDDYRAAAADESEARTRKNEAKQRLCAILGDAEVGLINGLAAVRWKNAHRSAYMVGESDYRKFSLVKQKGDR